MSENSLNYIEKIVVDLKLIFRYIPGKRFQNHNNKFQRITLSEVTGRGVLITMIVALEHFLSRSISLRLPVYKHGYYLGNGYALL